MARAGDQARVRAADGSCALPDGPLSPLYTLAFGVAGHGRHTAPAAVPGNEDGNPWRPPGAPAPSPVERGPGGNGRQPARSSRVDRPLATSSTLPSPDLLQNLYRRRLICEVVTTSRS